MDTDYKFPDKPEIYTLGCVVIGRNEGERLRASLESIPDYIRKQTVYVDSGSSDGSQELARQFGINVIELEDDKPFTAARARNEGAEKLLKLYPKIQYIQFIDGDCILEPGWLSYAQSYLEENTDVAIVCGRRREKYPESSIYNWLCDVEWDTPIGEAQFCGGDFCIKSSSFTMLGGFNPTLIAGEEPDLCFRLRNMGKKIHRLDRTMTWHDANIHSLKQWMIRSKRGGYAYVDAVIRYAYNKNGYWRSEFFKALTWGLTVPILSITATLLNPYFAFIFFIYPLNVIKIAVRSHKLSRPFHYGFFMILSKFSESAGILTYFIHRMQKTRTLIEYK